MEIKEKIQNWEKELNAITAQFKTAFGQLPAENLNRKPNAQTWSIAEIIGHLIRTNESYYPVVKAIRNGKQNLPFVANFRFLTNMLGNMILKGVSADRKKKVPTFSVWEPQQTDLGSDMVDRFEKHQKQLISFIKSTEDLLKKETIISSPANKMIVYKLESAFDILVEHEKRHFNQALEALKTVNK